MIRFVKIRQGCFTAINQSKFFNTGVQEVIVTIMPSQKQLFFNTLHQSNSKAQEHPKIKHNAMLNWYFLNESFTVLPKICSDLYK